MFYGEYPLSVTARPHSRVSGPSVSIAAAEVWQIDDVSQTLVLFERCSLSSSPFAKELLRGPGLGAAIAQQSITVRAPQIESCESLDLFEDISGIDCLVAFPSFVGKQVQGVLVLALQHGPEGRGAIELWSRNERDELGLLQSHFANLDLLARISPFVKFPRAAGLPGQTWDARTPKIIEDLHRDRNFMRASAAKQDGLTTGLSLPLMRSEYDLEAVLVFLSSAASPLARIFEIWRPLGIEEDEVPQLVCETLAADPFSDWRRASRSLVIETGDDLAGVAFERKKPVVFDHLPKLRSKRNSLADHHGFRQAVSLPVFVGNSIDSVVNFIF